MNGIVGEARVRLGGTGLVQLVAVRCREDDRQLIGLHHIADVLLVSCKNILELRQAFNESGFNCTECYL